MRTEALYARYSSENQRGNTSIDVQIETCERAAGHKLTHYIDEAKSGKTNAREALTRLIADAEAGKISRLYLYKYDRIGRNAHTHAVISDLEDLGVEVFSATEGRSALERGIGLVVAQDFSRQLGERVTAAQNKRFEQRIWVGGPPPYGYKLEHRDKRPYLTIHEPEAEVIRWIIKTYLSESVGCKELARRLMKEGKPTRHGADWAFTTVRGILVNRTLVGEVHFGKRKFKSNKATGKRTPIYLDPKSHKIYTDEALRIISDKDYQKVEAKLAERAKPQGEARAHSHVHPFTGLIHCSECNSIFYAQKSTNGGKHYYVCSCRQRKGRVACPKSQTFREDHLVEEVVRSFSDAFEDLDVLLDEVVKGAMKRLGVQKNDSAKIRKEIAELDQFAAGIARLMVDPTIDQVVKGELMIQVRHTAEKRAPLQARLDSMGDRAVATAESLGREARRLFGEARERFRGLAVSEPARLRGFIGDFVGPLTALPDGNLRVGGASAHSNIAPTRFDTRRDTVRDVVWELLAG